MNNTTQRTNEDLDAYIASIVRQVIARVKASQTTETQTTKTGASIADKVVTVATIEQLDGNPTQLFVSAKSIVTPAAHDAAKQRGIAIARSVELPPDQVPAQNSRPTKTEITDSQQPERAAAVAHQLSRRGINSIGTQVVLSDTPAADVHRYCQESGMRAVMITAVADVDRFCAELNPNVWVLDMKRLNLVAAVNVAANLARKP